MIAKQTNKSTHLYSCGETDDSQSIKA